MIIPQHKSDYESVERLRLATIDQLNSVVPQLIEWLQDMNWPVASEILKLIIKADDNIYQSQ